MDKFTDRQEAGTILAEYLKDYANQSNVIILALPRGGVPVAYEIATALAIPLDIFIVRKLGVPGHEELAMGAIASGGTVIFNELLISALNLDQSSIDLVLQAEQKELLRRELLYRGDRPFPKLLDKTIILVDDGIATGSTMFAAVKALRKYKPASIIIAVPVAARETCEEMTQLVEKVICPLQPINFYAVGLWYENFTQTSDNEVIELLEKSNAMMKQST
ncbi:phosphoribosyltransferase [Legionella drancourtii]|uniref:Phosphoribosyltransferase n=1 Tax=Legionella drancourtii LLAP12 TaxID=658187 RepID=G9EQJ8_9GAMM|nr:phosphoribosyltransferase [Legionella drancourtii]EHL30444.1 phosphoribosyltransferase [Legionella drancourtii LLAP12]